METVRLELAGFCCLLAGILFLCGCPLGKQRWNPTPGTDGHRGDDSFIHPRKASYTNAVPGTAYPDFVSSPQRHLDAASFFHINQNFTYKDSGTKAICTPDWLTEVQPGVCP